MAGTVLRRAVLALLLLLAVSGVWTAIVLGAARSDLLQARAHLESAREADGADSLGDELERARVRLQRSEDRLGQLGPVVVSRVPVLGRSVRAVARVASAGRAVTAASAEVVEATGDGGLLSGDGVDLDRLRAVVAALHRGAETTAGPVSELTATPDALVPGIVAGPLREAQSELGPAPAALRRAGDGVQALVGVLGSDRPRRLLVVLENNAELRGTGGLISVFAEVTTQDGRLEVGAFRDVEDVADRPSEAVRVPAPSDYQALWGPLLADTTLWRNTNADPDVPTSAQVLAAVAAASLPQAPDVVVRLDVPALAAVLRATGPARLPDGRELTADDAVEQLLSRAYLEAPDTTDGQAARRAALRGAADAVLGRLLGTSGDAASPVRLGPELADAAAGRHLSLWSADAAEQRLLVKAGLAGELPQERGDLASAAVHNLGGGGTEGNKIDFYARRSVRVQAVVGRDAAEVTHDVTLRNGAPSSGLPGYVAGTGTPGVSHNLLTMVLPAEAELLSLSRGDAVLDVAPQPSGEHAVVTDVVSLQPGTSVSWQLRYRLPVRDGRYDLAVVPQPLAVDAEAEVALSASPGLELSGDAAFAAPLDRTVRLSVVAERPSAVRRLAAAVRRFWDEPVRVPWS